jgi:DNA-nicking Smr family endonuclease
LVKNGKQLEDGLELWHAVTRGVRPLKGRPAPAPDRGARDETGSADAAKRPEPLPPPAQPVGRSAAKPMVPAPAPGPGLDKRSAERLRRGQLPIAARLDLHGMTQAEAHRALDAFIAQGVRRGRRCVLVITGKGVREDAWGREERGVLYSAVPRWLELPPNRGRILATARARPQHGGEGALYVLLRRQR